MKATIRKDVLRAVSLFAAKKDIRFYLVAVCVEFTPEDVRLIATNGHMLAACRFDYAEDDERPAAPKQAIIPLGSIATIKKAGRRDPSTVLLAINGAQFTLQDGESQHTGMLIDTKYPDWRRVIPNTVTGEPAQFNAEYVYAFHKAAVELGARTPSISIGHNGTGAATVNLGIDGIDTVGILMPMRSNSVIDKAPAWTRAPAAVAIKAVA